MPPGHHIAPAVGRGTIIILMSFSCFFFCRLIAILLHRALVSVSVFAGHVMHRHVHVVVRVNYIEMLIPILLYCTYVCPTNSAVRHSLQFTINKIMYKIFGAMSKDLL